ncbi:PIR Superfamily Protein [Plasmodium ovale curtisi]|uniref:PIR Superfamily Protein n=1 Tax=Plasmodium ovale curtisi TaxID=864141 RepID=A0A1A8X9I8_PLAOA|nr:PIR Superfamily Protein [Plasmodium ovale curtisi]
MNLKEREEYYNIVRKFLQFRDYTNQYLENTSGYFERVCKKIIKDHSERNGPYIESCINFLKYLKYLKNTNDFHENTASCKLVNYSLNKNLRNYLHDEQNTLNFYKNLKTEDVSKQCYIEKCENEIKYIQKYVLGNIESLYNLYLNFDKYTSSLVNDNLSHCYYANACSSIYNNCINTCDVQYDVAFCEILKKFKDEYNRQLSHENKCQYIKKVLSYPEKKNVRDTQHTRDRYGSYASGSISPKSNSPGNNITAAIVTLLVTPLTLFILYKFTPLGSWLRPQVKKYIGIGKNKGEEYQKLLSINSQNEKEIMYNNEYYIKYNASPQ